MLIRWSVVSLLAAFIFSFGLLMPQHNWDIIGYVAASFYKDGYRGEALREKTYADVKAEVNEKDFAGLVADGYRSTVYHDPVSLEQQVPFYTIKVVYVEGIRFLGKLGFTYSKSTYLISAIFAALSVIVVGLILASEKVPILMLVPIILTTGYMYVSGLSTSDAMACFFAILALYSAQKTGNVALVLAGIMPAIRTDFIIFSVLLQLYYWLYGKKSFAVVSLLTSVAIYFAVNKLTGNYGWLTLFNFVFIDLTPYPASLVPSTDPASYVKPYFMAAYNLLRNPHFVIYSLAAYLIVPKLKNLETRFILLYFVIPALFVILHLALFPAYIDRYFVFAATMMFLGICIAEKHAVQEFFAMLSRAGLLTQFQHSLKKLLVLQPGIRR